MTYFIMYAGDKECPRHWRVVYNQPTPEDYLHVARLYYNKKICNLYAKDESPLYGEAGSPRLTCYFMCYRGLLENTIWAMVGISRRASIRSYKGGDFFGIVQAAVNSWYTVKKAGKPLINGAGLYYGAADQVWITRLKDKVQYTVYLASKMARTKTVQGGPADNVGILRRRAPITKQIGNQRFVIKYNEHDLPEYYVNGVGRTREEYNRMRRSAQRSVDRARGNQRLSIVN